MILPSTFVSRTKEVLSNDFEIFLKALDEDTPVSIRLNPFKYAEINCDAPVIWASDAYYLNVRPSFTFDPLFHAGCYYVQEASSMFLEQFIKNYINEPVKCLDLCAAPGGKSTQLSSLLPLGSLLVANEVIRSRANILSENLIKWGNPSTIVTNSDPEIIGNHLPAFFDLVVADAPCSGEGMFRKDKEAITEWSLSNVQLCAERQRRIIADCWPALKPGGILIYSTCTYNTEENEENLQWIIETFGAESLNVPVPKDWTITGTKKYNNSVFRFIPGKTKGEGFFIAAVRKPDSDEFTGTKRKNKDDKKTSGKIVIPPQIKQWLTNPEIFDFELKDNFISAIPRTIVNDYKEMGKFLRIVHAGIPIAEIKGKDVIPNHALSLSVEFNKNQFPVVETEKETAIAYLKKEALVLDPDIPKGYVVLSFDKHPLGFVKNIGNRANNLYPQEWRIRKT